MLKVFLAVLVFNGPGNGSYYTYHPMESMEACLKAAASAQIQIANGGDSEGAVALFCTNGHGEKK
jgi:hypothetical protein